MHLEKKLPVDNNHREAMRYQISFDLRRNIARVISHYSMEAVRKDITLDINVSLETPNYFHGNANYFLEIFSQLLKVSIEFLDKGIIYIRICHDSAHQTNSCETDLSVSITTFSQAPISSDLSYAVTIPGYSKNPTGIPLVNCTTLQRIKNLCAYLAGSLVLKKLDEHKTLFRVNCILQRAFPTTMQQQA